MRKAILGIYGATLALLLAGCNENNTETDVSPTVITLSPALGQVFNAQARLTTLAGRHIDQAMLKNGQATLRIPFGMSGPFLATVCGGATAAYFDEALRANAPLKSGECLRALVPDGSSRKVALSVLSESVVRYFEHHGGVTQARPVDIRLRHAAFAKLMGLEASIKQETLPTRIGNTAELKALQRRYTGVDRSAAPLKGDDHYAFLLASLAEAGHQLAQQRNATPESPAFAVSDRLAADLADGMLDGKEGDVYIVSPVYDGLQLNARLTAVMQRQLKEQLGEAFPVVDLNSQAGRDYLQAHQLRQPPLMQVTRSAPDDVLLSWQGQYNGKWRLGGNIATGKQYSYLLPDAYRDYMGQLVEGDPCSFTVDDQALVLNGLPFAINPLVRSTADEHGIRVYGLGRLDQGLISVEALGGMQTRQDRVEAVGFNVRASAFMFTLDAQVSCEVSE